MCVPGLPFASPVLTEDAGVGDIRSVYLSLPLSISLDRDMPFFLSDFLGHAGLTSETKAVSCA